MQGPTPWLSLLHPLAGFTSGKRMGIVRSCLERGGELSPQRFMVDRADVQAYGVQMSEIPKNGPSDPDEGPGGNEVPADAFSPVVDPDLVPDGEGATPEEKRARRDPEETGS